jgi:hypothetical protein
MVDWGPDDWGNDVDWGEVEQQAAKRQKYDDERPAGDPAASQVWFRLPAE